MSELEWDEWDGEASFDSSNMYVVQCHEDKYSLHYNDFDGPRLGKPALTVKELRALARRIENVLDPPECPTKHTDAYGNSWFGQTMWGKPFDFCPSCGQLLEGSKGE